MSPHNVTAVTTAESSRAPRPVRTAAILWVVAIAAGVFETVLAIVGLLGERPVPFGELVTGAGVRLVVFVVAGCLVVRLLGGRNWARWALTLLLGMLGGASLLIDPVRWLLDGNDLGETLAAFAAADWLFAVSRVVHLGAVVAALVSMFRPESNRYLTATTHGEAACGLPRK
ncbi:hypothetical protein SaccyDRAFT_4004 [Saccharomonospora cyanea NA-134]|uniref:Uncharacterized protein n=1 Tax=Saccharomonospora cyanea NA-134 TaxID=882082 RepID=H5XIG6_9PSEU|nr:hypothetical protein SaccyDRAFT_4004 [Saccharomonospora cyanea NA-134]